MNRWWREAKFLKSISANLRDPIRRPWRIEHNMNVYFALTSLLNRLRNLLTNMIQSRTSSKGRGQVDFKCLTIGSETYVVNHAKVNDT